MPKNTKQEWIVVLSTYPPRECGIATFAASLVKALNTQLPRNIRAKVVAINKSASHHYIYPNEVVDQVIESDKADFIRVAKSLTVNPRVKAVIVQHEFGIYGKHAGAVLVDFLRHLNKPVLTVLHTVEQRPRPEYKQVLQQIAAQSHALITMNHTATHLLADVYGIQDGPSIHVIPHGIPEILPYDRFAAKKRLQLGGKDVLITFGLLSPDKSVDTVIRALPGIVKKFPKATYVIVGQTHPNIVARDGEVYRKSLERLVTTLHMDAHVKFVNHYMSEQDILQYLSAADLYVLSPRNPNQIVSGTLAYAMGAGKAVVSTPFLHAKEMAQQGLIHLANFESPASFRKEICALLDNPELRKRLEHRSYEVSRSATWNNVALNYYNVLISLQAIAQPEFTHITSTESVFKTLNQLPSLKMEHLRRLTDDFGVIQFSHYNLPDVSTGYTTDDVARALIARCMYWMQHKTNTTIRSINTYLTFLEYVTAKNGKIYNDVSFQRDVDRSRWSSDAHARAVWALAYLATTPGLPSAYRTRARALLRRVLPATRSFTHPRSLAFSLLGDYWLRDKKQVTQKADKLVALYRRNATRDWHWFGRSMTYSNSKLPEALFHAYQLTKNPEYRTVAIESLAFLIRTTIIDDVFQPIGQDGWYFKGKKRALYDQQPIEAAGMVRTLLVAHHVTRDSHYLQYAFIVYQWFMGRNALRQRLYDESTGGCFDGLTPTNVNCNQGAESTIGHITARLCFEKEVRLI